MNAPLNTAASTSPCRDTPPRLLTIAGSDSGGGAGVQADLKTFAAHGAYGMSALTAVTAQNTRAVSAVHALPAELVAAQIDAVFEDLGVDAVKIGMLADAAIARAVADALRRHGAGRSGDGRVPVVLDPVMVAKSGDALLADEAVRAVVEELLPLATLITPNLPEARRLLREVGGAAPEADSPQADSLQARLAMGEALAAAGPAVLVKGGHGEGDEVTDLLVVPAAGGGAPFTHHRWSGRRIAGRATHGTGCTLSSAIAARLGAGADLPAAVEGAIAYLRRAMEAAYPLGSGHGPVNHAVPA